MGVDNYCVLTREEFKELFDMHFASVRNHLFFRLGNTDVATDLAQETFLKVWEKRGKIQKEKIKGLLFKIANDLYISHYRKEKRSFDFFNTYQLKDAADSPEELMAFEQLKAKYEKVLARLPEKQRTVFLMSRVDKLTYVEIGERTGISTKAVEKRMKKAFDYLRLHLQAHE